MTSIPLLHLRIEGPMQSWGIRSRWNYRDTTLEPTKSGIIGIIACALGYKRGDLRIEELDEQLKMGVRVERSGKVEVDYHTVSGKHHTASGQVKEHTELTYRSYIDDASFLVVLSGKRDVLQKVEFALKDPKWPLYLGRKSCPPTIPIFDRFSEEYDSIEEALINIPWSCEHYLGSRTKKPPEELRCVIEDDRGDLVRADAIKINPARMYGKRRVREFWTETPFNFESVYQSNSDNTGGEV